MRGPEVIGTQRSLLLAAMLAAGWLGACAPAVQPEPGPAGHVGTPSSPDGLSAGEPRDRDASAGVAAANPHAVEAGLEILAAGGSAADAAVAVQAMLGLVEPQSSGIGGGAFMLYYDAATRDVTAFDGREAAPAAATASLFLDESGEPLSYRDAVLSGRSTGAPGAVAMLGIAHARFGRLPWARLFEPAIERAEKGLAVPQRLARFAGGDFPQAREADARALFGKPDGSTIQAGEHFENPAYAGALRQVAAQGPRALLEPPLADAIIRRAGAPPRPGALSRADLRAYAPRVSEPLCGPFLVYVVCVPPPPSSGVVLLQMLAILERTDIAERGPDDPEAWFQFAAASRLMYADRDRYVADPAFVDVPVAGLLAPDYVARRAALIGEVAGPAPEAGVPAPIRRARDQTREAAGTSHFVIVDPAGNVASVTTTVESLFGSGRAVSGFFLNNQLTDFAFSPVGPDGAPVANAVEPGKRPRSSMTPVIVLDGNGRVVAALGSPGGTSILAYVAKALVGLLAWELPLQEAIDLPNVVARGSDTYGEAAKFPPALLEALAARGFAIKPGRGEESGLHGIVLHADGRTEGAADPRREGIFRQLKGTLPSGGVRPLREEGWN